MVAALSLLQNPRIEEAAHDQDHRYGNHALLYVLYDRLRHDHVPRAANPSILTQPDGAECEITDVAAGKSIVKAKTPHTAALERGDGYFQKKYYDITLSKEGYVTEKVSIAPELNPWYIGNLLFGGIPGMLIVDPLTGSMWRFEEKDVSVKLYPDTPEGRAARAADEQARAEAKAKEEREQRIKQAEPSLTR